MAELEDELAAALEREHYHNMLDVDRIRSSLELEDEDQDEIELGLNLEDEEEREQNQGGRTPISEVGVVRPEQNRYESLSL